MSNVDLSKGIKIILLGESGVGKTNLIRVTTGEEFEQNSMSSSSGSYKEGTYISSTKKKYVYHLWDTAGQEAYRSLNKIFIKNAKVVIFVYAIDAESSFKELKYWIDLAKSELGNDFVMGIVANKIDLYEEQQVKEEVAIEFAKSQNIKFRATSALTEPLGFKSFLEELLIDYIKKIDPSYKDEVPVYGGNSDNSFTLKKGGNNKKKNKGCCQ
jgi:small GTP-binding protein